MRYFSILLLTLLPVLLQAQSPKERLEAVYGEQRVQELQKETPERYDYLLFRMENVYELIPAREGKSYQELKKVEYYAKKREKKKEVSSQALLKKVENGNFNHMKCHLQRKKSENSYYELKGTGKVLVLLSEDKVAEKYNAQR